MSVIIRLQNLPWSANAMDIRTFFRGLSIPEGGVHIVGGEQGDAFIAFSTDEDARQAMMNDGGRIKEVQVKLLLSSRSEMHKVIESARQSVSFMQLASQPALPAQPIVTQPAGLPAALSGLLAQNIKHMGLPSALPLSNLIENPKPDIQAVDDRDSKRNRDLIKGNDRKQRSRSSSRDRSKKDRGRDKKDKRDRSRSRDRSRERERRRRDRSRSRERRDRKRDRKDRSRDRERSKEKSESRSSFRNEEKKKDIEINVVPPMLQNSSESFMLKSKDGPLLGVRPPGPILTPNDPRRQFGVGGPMQSMPNMQVPRQPFMNRGMNIPRMGWSQDAPLINPQGQMSGQHAPRVPLLENNALVNMYNQHSQSPKVNNSEELHRLQELGERRNPNAFQNTEPTQNHSPPQDPRQRLNVYNDMNFQKSNNSRPPPQNYNEDREQPFLESRKRFMNKGLCVKLTNLPLHTGYGDIRRFFVGQYISGQGLKMINDDNGRRRGMAYIKFIKPESKVEALRKSGKNLKGEFITVTHLEEEEFENAIDAFQPGNASKGEDSMESGDDDATSQKSLVIVEHEEKGEPFKVLFLEDLPPFAKEHDIMKMFSDYSLLSITLIATKDFRKQYIAYVQFVNADDAKAALNNKAKHLIGHKSIIVSPCSEIAYEQAKMAQNNAIDNIQDSNDADMEPEPRMEEEPVPQSRDPRQRRFENRVDNSVPFNNNSGPYPAPGMLNVNPRFPWRPNNPASLPPGDRERPPMVRGMAPMIPNDFDRNKRFNEVRLDCVFIKGLPLRTTDRDILDFFSDVGVIPTKIHLMLTVQGEPSGDCFCEFLEPEEAASATNKNGTMLGVNIINVEPVPKSVVDEALGIIPPENKHFGPPMRGFRGGRGFIPRGRGRGMRGGRDFSGRGGGRFNGPPSNMHSKDNNQGPEGFGNPGCVLSLENLPFHSGIDEVLEFFSGFNIAQSDVIRRFNDNGLPTGDARVSFRSPFEAQRAMKQLNMQCIRGRPITIRLL